MENQRNRQNYGDLSMDQILQMDFDQLQQSLHFPVFGQQGGVVQGLSGPFSYHFVDDGSNMNQNYESLTALDENRVKRGVKPDVLSAYKKSGYERFQMELQRDGLRIEHIIGDANCMYRSIADQLQLVNPRKSYHYQYVKGRIMQYIGDNADTYKYYVEDNDIERYLQNKERDDAWGGIIELKVAAKIFEVNVYVYSTTEPSWGLQLFEGGDVRTILLSCHGNSHYNSLRKIPSGFQSNLQMWTIPEQYQKERREKQFLDELRKEKLEIVEVWGTGNRLFHAVADQLQQVLGQKNIDHKKVRDDIYSHMKKNKQKYQNQIENGDVDKYVKKMMSSSEDGSNVELEAIAAHYKVNVKVFCTDQPTYKIESPNKSGKWIFLSYHDNSYYNSLEKIAIEQSEDVPTQPSRGYILIDRKKQFLDDLKREQLEIVEVWGSGNRLFHAVADQLQQVLGQKKIDHKKVRDDVYSYMKKNKKKFKNQVEDVDKYVKKMKETEENGTDVELQAVAAHYQVNIKVFCTDEPTYIIKSPFETDKWIFLSYHDNSYYNSLEKITDTPPQQPEEVHSHKSSTAQDLQNTLSSNSNMSRLMQPLPPPKTEVKSINQDVIEDYSGHVPMDID